GGHEWDSQAICDPTVLVENGEVRVWFGGGDRPSRDEGLDGQIGYAKLRPVDAPQGPPDATLAK
ncbi:MAG TPA: hypothetical protein VGS58_18405, partial [Candidatus Sulfopaludibacter sp.]|nr:hypothetical protein [Candidatus Sulfopaludibacter sp.]